MAETSTPTPVSVNTADLITPVNDNISVVDPDFTAGSFVNRREPVSEISSLLSELYIEYQNPVAPVVAPDDDDEENNDDDDENNDEDDEENVNGDAESNVASDREERQYVTQAVYDELKGEFQTLKVVNGELKGEVNSLKNQLFKLETDFRDSVNSSLNREAQLRKYLDTALTKMNEGLKADLEKSDRATVNCFLRRDEKWRQELASLRPTSTPIASRTVAVATEVSPIAPLHPLVCLVHIHSPLRLTPNLLCGWNFLPSVPRLKLLMSLPSLSSVRTSWSSAPYPTMNCLEPCLQCSRARLSAGGRRQEAKFKIGSPSKAPSCLLSSPQTT